MSKTKAEILDCINALISSCEEGQSGDWDASVPSGHSGFEDMIILLEKVQKYVEVIDD